MRILNVSFKVISDSILESFSLDFKNLAALGAKVSLALFLLGLKLISQSCQNSDLEYEYQVADKYQASGR